VTPRPPRGYRLVGREPSGLGLAGRPLSGFVGRERELAALEGLLTRAATGAGQAVVLMGEPGVGKSRLVYEFRERVIASGSRWVEAHCASSATARPHGPIVEALRHILGVIEDDDPAVVMLATRERLEGLGLDADAHAPFLQTLLGAPRATGGLKQLSPEAIRLRTFEALHWLFLGLSLGSPLVLAVEDLHWIDPTSEAYLTALVDRLAGARVLLLTTSRPGSPPPWLNRSHVSQLALPPLLPADSLVVVRSIATADRLPDVSARSIVARADGNPFFLEELSWTGLTKDFAPGSLPGSIRDTLRARIDRLPDAIRGLLGAAAVLGREFPTSLLRGLARDEAPWTDPEGLDRLLGNLVTREFLNPRPGAPEPAYVFKHALTQEVAYGLLDGDQRSGLHEAAGEALERLFAGRLEVVLEQLAYHYGLSANREKAVAYLTRVADRATATYALVEALAALEGALSHAERLTGVERDRQAVAILTRHALPMLLVGRLGEARDLLLRHSHRIDRLDDPALSGPYCFGLAHLLDHLGLGAEAAPWAERALREATRCGDVVTQGRAHLVLSTNNFWRGRLVESVEHGQLAVALLRPTTDSLYFGLATWFTGFGSIWLGRFADASTMATQTRDIGDRTGDPRTQCYADKIAGWTHVCQGDVEQGLTHLNRALDKAPDALATLAVRGPLGFAQLEAGQPEAAVESLERSASACRQMGIAHFGAWMTAWLGEAHLAAGRPDRARTLAEQALTQAREIGFPMAEGLAQRLLGRLATAAGTHDEAADVLQEAMRLFTSHEARYETARTLLDLAATARANGDCEATARHLAAARALFEALGVRRPVEPTAALGPELRM
jgi:tetratricopeptide (TPR) repeat protein